MNVKELLISVGFSVHQAELAETVGAVTIAEKALEVVIETVRELGREFLGAPARMAGFAEQLDNLHQSTGLSVETLQTLKIAADHLQIPFEAITGSMRVLTRQAYAASQGNAEARKSFSTLGVSVYDSNGQLKQGEALFGDIGAALQKVENPTKRAALAQQVLGRGALALIPLLNKGKEGLEKFKEMGIETGAIFSGEVADSLKEYDDQLDELKLVHEGLVSTVGQALLPAFKELARRSLEFWKANGPMIRGVLTKAFQAFGDALLFASSAIRFLGQHWKLVVSAIALGLGVLIAMNLAAIGSFIATAASAAIAWLIAAAPIIGIVALLGLLALVIEDVWVGLTGGRSVILGLLAKAYLAFKDFILGALPKLWESFKDWFFSFWQKMLENIPGLKAFVDFVVGKGTTMGGGENVQAAVDLANGGIASPDVQVIPQTTTIQVDASGQKDPAAVGTAVADAFDAHMQKQYEQFEAATP